MGAMMAEQETPTATPERRAKQALGKLGDFWALVDMASNIDKCKSVLADIKSAGQGLTDRLAELRRLQADVDLREQALAKMNAETTAAQVRADAALVQRATKQEAAERDLATRRKTSDDDRLQLQQRETAVTAREAKLKRDEDQARQSLVEQAKALNDRDAALTAAEMAHADAVKAFEAKFAKAKAILSAVPDDDIADTQAAAG